MKNKKLIILIVGILLVAAGVLCFFLWPKKSKKEIYIEAVKKSLGIETIENKKDELVPTVEDKNAKVWPLVVIIDALLIIVALSMTSWTSVFKVQFFDKLTTSALGKFGLLLGEVGAFERWSVTEVASLMIFASIIVALIYKVKIGEYISSALEGIKKALKPAMLAILIYVVLVAVSYNPIVLTIIKPLISKHLNVFTMGVSAFVASIFNVDMYYAAQSTLPYITSVITKTQVYPSIALIWQIMYGFTSLVAPTSIILIPVLSYLGISYKDWFKSNWMFILEVLLLCVLTFIALLLFV